MGSPFIYEDPLEPPEALADRTAELALLRDRIAETRNSRLEGPRRYGKTSLLKAALERAEKDGFVPVYVNFLGVLTAADVAERIEDAYREQLEGKLKRWFSGVISTLHPRAKVAPGGVGVEVAPEIQRHVLTERLRLPRRLYERHGGRQCAIAFDEFQDVVRVGPSLTGTIRSELEQQGKVAAYVFSGSHPGLMRDLFADRRHAFFSQASPVELEPLPSEDLADYVGSRFENGGRDPGEALEALLRTAQGHPQRAMLLAHHLYEHTPHRSVATTEEWADGFARATREADSEVQAAWDSWTNTERRLMAVISERTTPLQGQVARERYGISKTGSNQKSIEQLHRAGHIVADNTTASRWRIVDPLLEIWLLNGRTWPT